MFDPEMMTDIKMFVRTGDDYIDGRFVRGSEVETTISVCIQRLSINERQLLPEGNRSRETYKFYTEFTPIQILDNDQATIHDAAEFEYKGKRFTMIASEQWEQVLEYSKVTIVGK
jgi:hypothetical protein